MRRARSARARWACGRRRPAATRSRSLARSFNEMASQLEQRTQALERSDRTRRQLLADVSHELSTPLAAIRGYVETLSMAEVPLTENTRRRYLHIVTDETERLEHIVGDLLELARLEGGGGSWREDDVSIAQLLERVRHRHEPKLREKNVTLSTEREASAETIVRRPEPPRAGAPEPRRQRDSSHPARGNRDGSCRVTGRSHRPLRRRHRARHLPGAFAADLRSVLQGRRVPCEHGHLVRQRPWPVDRSRDRDSSWRHGDRVERPGRRRACSRSSSRRVRR